jgi:hypothetical protein
MMKPKIMALVIILIIFGLLCGLSIGLTGCVGGGGGGNVSATTAAAQITETYGANQYYLQLTAIAGDGK